MDIEQTTQLLQLILNSLLLTGICAVWMVVLVVRLQGLRDWLQDQGSQVPVRWLGPPDPRSSTRRQVSVRRGYRSLQQSLLLASYALAGASASAVLLAGRSLLNWNGLIIGALVLFLVGLVLLLGSVLQGIAGMLRGSEGVEWYKVTRRSLPPSDSSQVTVLPRRLRG